MKTIYYQNPKINLEFLIKKLFINSTIGLKKYFRRGKLKRKLVIF